MVTQVANLVWFRSLDEGYRTLTRFAAWATYDSVALTKNTGIIRNLLTDGDHRLVVLCLTALWANISVYIGPSPKEREKEEKGQMRVKMSKPSPPAPTASAIGPCPTIIKNVGRPGTGSLPSTIAPPDPPPRWPSKRSENTELTYD